MTTDPFADWDPRGFPKIGMTVNDEKGFKTLAEAVPLFDSGWAKVELTDEVLLADFSVRTLTNEESSRLSDLADEYSDSK